MADQDTPSTVVSVSQPRGPLGRVLDLFSNIWTGVVLLILVFVYSSVGSALPALRQMPFFEMTEYEWFHWWPFNTLIALICLTLVVVTLRRIPFKPINFGVWMIHSGIIVLALGSAWYFGTKVEGDVPVVRRQIRIEFPGREPVSLVAMPGNAVVLQTDDTPYHLQIASIDPQWEILSGEDQGKRAYSVNVRVQTRHQTFIRQLLAGYPEYTEDIIRTDDPEQPMARARKVLGKPLVDDDLKLSLEYAPQEWFYLSNDLTKSWALYLRERSEEGDAGEWIERPIEGLGLYNDRVADPDDVWIPPSPRDRPGGALSVDVGPVDETKDPFAETTIKIKSYLRYAVMDTRRRMGGDVFNPAVGVRVQNAEGRGEEYQLVARDPVAKMDERGRLVFEWVESEVEYDELSRYREPVLEIEVPGSPGVLEVPIRDLDRADSELPFAPIEGTDYHYRVQRLHDGLRLPTGEVISVAVVQIKTPDRTFVRWVSDDPRRTRDLPDDADPAAAHGDPLTLDTNVVMRYVPAVRPPMITIVGGPAEDQLRLIVALGSGPPRAEPLVVGRPVDLRAGISLTVLQFATRTERQTKPAIIAREQRNRDARARLAMIQVELPGDNGPQSHWLHFHDWPIRDATHELRRITYRPTEVTLPDGRTVELMFSRQRQRLPSPVVLDDFVMDTHVGGFTGQNISVLNWTSEVRFLERGQWGARRSVSVNDPREFGGLWYFQAQWDPPNPQEGYRGLNFTVLGVGNRDGVQVMLLGCCIAVIGMIYAFYVKPLIKQRQQRAVYAEVAAFTSRPQTAQAPILEPMTEPIGAAGKERS